MNQKEAIESLYESDHAIISVEYAREIAQALGMPVDNVPVHEYRTNPRANNGKGVFMEKEGPGVGAHNLAEMIADYLKLSYPSMMGIGSRLRVATKAIQEHLKIAV